VIILKIALSLAKLTIILPMINVIYSIFFVYIFIFLGFLAKKIFKDEINSKTLTLISVYFTQPFVTVWGFSSAKLELFHFLVAIIYLSIIVALLIPTIFLAKKLFSDKKERAIFTIAGFVGNTGNIGIPLGLALFGSKSVIYTTIINLSNVFVVYILGVYIYSRGSFSIKESIKNIFKIRIIPASLIAGGLNLSGFVMPQKLFETIQMGAYAGIVLQLILLGTFLEKIDVKKINKRLYSAVLGYKFIIIPLATYIILNFLNIDNFIKNILLMQMITPLAVANINLASLYNCRPKDVTNLIIISTVLFIFVIILFKRII
jgi:predicted permease